LGSKRPIAIILNCKHYILAVLGLLWAQAAFCQAQDSAFKEPINTVDENGRRTGLWLLNHEAKMGEEAFYEFGHYDIGHKTGLWYRVDADETLLAIENYQNDVLHGEVKYFDHGLLLCVGHYRAMNTDKLFDTFLVVDPISDTLVQRIIPSDHGSLKHGEWKYYNEETGKLAREEEYQIDQLIYSKDFPSAKQREPDDEALSGEKPKRKQKIKKPLF